MTDVGTDAKGVEKKEHKDAKCVVHFRPHSTYNGEYGFDWLRMGDTGFSGDTWYAKIVGHYIGYYLGLIKYNKQIYDGGTFEVSTDEYEKLRKEYGSKSISWKKTLGQKDWLYSVPVMTLWKGDKVNLTLKLDVEEEPEKLILKFDDAFDVTPKEITNKAKGKRELSNFLTIECLKEFNINKDIEIISINSEGKEESAGKLTIMGNHSMKKDVKKILLVNVITIDNNGIEEEISDEDASECKDLMKKYFKQFYAEPYFESAEINLIQTKTNPDGTTDKILNNDFETKYVTNGNIKANYSGLHNYLKGKLNNKELYEDYYKVYLISKECPIIIDGVPYTINGQAQDIPSKQAVIFKTGLNGDTITHELLHAMGLYHTFDNDGKFVFEKFKTDNIMDYKATGIKRICTWKWQWKILNKKL